MTSNDEGAARHNKLPGLRGGDFSTHELAIYGTTCEEINQLFDLIKREIPERLIVSIDEMHGDHEGNWNHVTIGKGNHHFSHFSPDNKWQWRAKLNHANATLINGNHRSGQQQLIVANSVKAESLSKRKEQLSNVKLILLPEGVQEIPNYLKEIISTEGIPFFKWNEKELWINHIKNDCFFDPPLKALVLTGGKSQRMGRDKSWIEYHGIPQYQYLIQLLSHYAPVSISCREEQKVQFEDSGYPVIVDRFNDMGPLAGMMSAFMSDPNAAWLVVACDLPLVDRDIIENLIQARNPSSCATAFIGNYKALPEPLIAIWEPSSYPQMLSMLAQGNMCPRKVLMNCNTHLVDTVHVNKLFNVNHPEELELAWNLTQSDRSLEEE